MHHVLQVLNVLGEAASSKTTDTAGRPVVSLTGAVSAASTVCDAVVAWLVENLQLVVEIGDDPEHAAALSALTYAAAARSLVRSLPDCARSLGISSSASTCCMPL